MLENTTLLIINVICCVAALVSALSGFGYSLFATSCISLFMSPRLAVPLVLFSSLILLALLFFESRNYMDWTRINKWLLGALPGIWLGGFVLSNFSDVQMRSLIGFLTLVGATMLWWRPGVPFKRETPWAIIAGIVSGIMVGASSMSGPPVVLFGIKQQWDHISFRATLIGYFAIIHLLALLVLGQIGVAKISYLLQGVWVLPGLLLGLVVGMRFKARVNNKFFRMIALSLLLTSGIAVTLMSQFKS